MSSPRRCDRTQQRVPEEIPTDDVTQSPVNASPPASPPASLLCEPPIEVPRDSGPASEEKITGQHSSKVQNSLDSARKKLHTQRKALIPSFEANSLGPASFATTPNRSPGEATALFDGDDLANTSGESAPNEAAPVTANLDVRGRNNLSPEYVFDSGVNPWTVPTARPSKSRSHAPARSHSKDRPKEIHRNQFPGPPAVGDPVLLRKPPNIPIFPPPSREQYPPGGDLLFNPLPPEVDGIDVEPVLGRYNIETRRLVGFMINQEKRCERSYGVVLGKDAHLFALKKRIEDCIAAQAQMEEERQIARERGERYTPRSDLVKRCKPPCSGQHIYNLEQELLKKMEDAVLDRAVLEGSIAGAGAVHRDQYDDKMGLEQISVLLESNLLLPPSDETLTDFWALLVSLKKPNRKQPHYSQVDKIRTGYFAVYKQAYWDQWELAAKDSSPEDAEIEIPREVQVPHDLLSEWSSLFPRRGRNPLKQPFR